MQWLLEFNARLGDIHARAYKYASDQYLQRGLPLLAAVQLQHAQVLAAKSLHLRHSTNNRDKVTMLWKFDSRSASDRCCAMALLRRRLTPAAQHLRSAPR